MNVDYRRSYWPVCGKLRACRCMVLLIRRIMHGEFQLSPVIWRDTHPRNCLNTWLLMVFLPVMAIIMPWVLWNVWDLRNMVVHCAWVWRTIIRLRRLTACWGVWNNYREVKCRYEGPRW